MIIAASIAFAQNNLTGSLLLSTLILVTFNKVCTTQYFTWYIVFIPIYFGSRSEDKSVSSSILMVSGVWVLGLLLWLYKAHALEFLGQAVFLDVWICSLIFQGINAVLIGLIAHDIRKHNAETLTTLINRDCIVDQSTDLAIKSTNKKRRGKES